MAKKIPVVVKRRPVLRGPMIKAISQHLKFIGRRGPRNK